MSKPNLDALERRADEEPEAIVLAMSRGEYLALIAYCRQLEAENADLADIERMQAQIIDAGVERTRQLERVLDAARQVAMNASWNREHYMVALERFKALWDALAALEADAK